MPFQCASNVNQMECTLDAHQSHSHSTTGWQIQSKVVVSLVPRLFLLDGGEKEPGYHCLRMR